MTERKYDCSCVNGPSDSVFLVYGKVGDEYRGKIGVGSSDFVDSDWKVYTEWNDLECPKACHAAHFVSSELDHYDGTFPVDFLPAAEQWVDCMVTNGC